MPTFVRVWCYYCLGLAVSICLSPHRLASYCLCNLADKTVQFLPNQHKTTSTSTTCFISCCLAVLRQIRSTLFCWIFCRSNILLQQGSIKVSNHSGHAKHFPSTSRQFMECSDDNGLVESCAPTRAQRGLKLLRLLEQRSKETMWCDGVGSHKGFANAGATWLCADSNRQWRHCSCSFSASCMWMKRECLY